MEVLQKMTLYDLLGYAVPGSCMLIILLFNTENIALGNKLFTSYAGYLVGAIILFGYVLGIAISEVTDFILSVSIKRTSWFLCGNPLKLYYERLALALGNAGIADFKDFTSVQTAETGGDSAALQEKVAKYSTYIYSEIQADKTYSRIHNYASAALICKNMAFVTVVSGIVCYNKHFVLWIVLAAAFLRRWRKNYWKKEEYAADWFIQKHLEPNEESMSKSA